MAFLFDTDAISESLKRQPLAGYLAWLRTIPQREQFTRVARLFGAMQAELERVGQVLADADVQIAATALHYDLQLVTGNLRHFRRVSGLRIFTVLDDARRGGS